MLVQELARKKTVALEDETPNDHTVHASDGNWEVCGWMAVCGHLVPREAIAQVSSLVFV